LIPKRQDQGGMAETYRTWDRSQAWRSLRSPGKEYKKIFVGVIDEMSEEPDIDANKRKPALATFAGAGTRPSREAVRSLPPRRHKVKSKHEVLSGLIGNESVGIDGSNGGYVVTVGNDPSKYATSIIEEVGDQMIHVVNPRYRRESWIDIAWISEIQMPFP
jgi:hypothetical protein